jgi:hypothetical protein
MRRLRIATLGAGTAIAALAITGWLAPASGSAATVSSQQQMPGMSRPASTTASSCPQRAPHSHEFTFWHPDLTTMHLWIWYPNPDGLYGSTNPLVTPFNRG